MYNNWISPGNAFIIGVVLRFRALRLWNIAKVEISLIVKVGCRINIDNFPISCDGNLSAFRVQTKKKLDGENVAQSIILDYILHARLLCPKRKWITRSANMDVSFSLFLFFMINAPKIIFPPQLNNRIMLYGHQSGSTFISLHTKNVRFEANDWKLKLQNTIELKWKFKQRNINLNWIILCSHFAFFTKHNFFFSCSFFFFSTASTRAEMLWSHSFQNLMFVV